MRVFSVPVSVPFLRTVISALVDGRLVAGFEARNDPGIAAYARVNAKLAAYWQEFGEPDLIFVSAPQRLWSDQWRAKPAPPFGPEHAFSRVPWDLPVPTTDTLLRTYTRLCYGRVERSAGGDSCD